MKIQIKNRFSGKVIIEGEAENIKEFLEKNREADLHGADLRGMDLRGVDLCEADLHGADLCEADLREADLRGADLHEAKIRITQKDEFLKALKIEIIE